MDTEVEVGSMDTAIYKPRREARRDFWAGRGVQAERVSA
jgi:hypothetical protein